MIHRREQTAVLSRCHQAALGAGDASGDARDRSGHPRIGQVELGLAQIRLGGLERRVRQLLRRDRVIEFLLADRLLVGERLEARGFAPRLLLASALLRHLRIRLGEGDLVGDGIDLEERAAFAHEIPLVVEALEKDSRNACAHLDFLGALHLADGLENDGHALRRHLEHLGRNAGGGRVGCGSVGPALLASCEQGRSDQSRESRQRWGQQTVAAAEIRPSVNGSHAGIVSCLRIRFERASIIYNHECMTKMLRLRLA